MHWSASVEPSGQVTPDHREAGRLAIGRERLLGALPMVVTVFDAEHRCLYLNRADRGTKEHFVGFSWRDRLFPSQVRRMDAALARMARTGERQTLVVVGSPPVGPRQIYRLSLQPFDDGQGAAYLCVASVGVVSDLLIGSHGDQGLPPVGLDPQTALLILDLEHPVPKVIYAEAGAAFPETAASLLDRDLVNAAACLGIGGLTQAVTAALGGQRALLFRHQEPEVEIWYQIEIDARAEPDGTIVQAIVRLRAQSLRETLEARLHLRDSLFEVFCATVPFGVFVSDTEGRVHYVNRQLGALVGKETDDLMGLGWLRLVVPEHSGAVGAMLSGLRDRLSGGWDVVREVRSPAGSRHLRLIGSPVAVAGGAGGGPGAFVGIVEDVTAQRAAQESLRDSLAEQRALVAEVHHRVKNNLQLISSLVYLAQERISDPASAAVFCTCLDRIQAVAAIHEQLHRRGALAMLTLDAYIRDMAGHIMEMTPGIGRRIQLHYDLERVQVPQDIAVPVGMILNELLTNAVRHAFVGNATGEIRIRLRRAGQMVEMKVEDNGRGMPPDGQDDGGGSLGLKLVSILARQLRATVGRESGNGTRVTLTLELPDADAFRSR